MATFDAPAGHRATTLADSNGEATIVRQMAELVDAMSEDRSESVSAMRDIAECLQLFTKSNLWSMGTSCVADHADTTIASNGGPRQSVETEFTSNRFEIRRLLGHGGFGVVLLTYDKRLGREVALKVPRPEILASRGMRDRFIREAQAAAALDHPNIVPVYDTGEVGPIWFIASRYINGPTLAEWIHKQNSPISPQLAAELVALLAEAVQHAHSRGVLHCDLKPANVILEPSNTQPDREFPFIPRLSDFGLARRLDENERSTEHNSLVGTPRYMAPEQAACRHKDVGIHTDVYGLGGILFELLAGSPPFVGQNDEETVRLINNEPVPVTLLVQCRIPRDLQAICLKSLEKTPSNRYESSDALAADLRCFLNGLPVQARPVGRAERLAHWCRRRPLQAALYATLCLVTLLGIAGVTWQWIRAEQNLALARTESSRAEENLRQVELSFIDLAWVFEEAELWSGSDSSFPTIMADKLQRYSSEILPQYVDNDQAPQPILAAIYAMNAKHSSQMNQPQDAEQSYRKSIDVWREVLRRHPESVEYARALAITLFGYANHLLKSGSISLDGQNPNLVQTMFATLRLPPEDEIRAMKAYAHMMSNLGDVRIRRQRIPEALAAFEWARQTWHELNQRSTDTEFQAMEATMLSSIAVNQHRFFRDLIRSMKSASQARQIMEAVVEQEPNRLNFKLLLANALRVEAFLNGRMRKPVQAMPLYEKALSIRIDWVRDHPEDTVEREELGKVSLEFAQLLSEWKKSQAALPYYQLTAEHWDALLLIGKLSAENVGSLPMVHYRVGEEQDRLGHIPEAIAALRRSIEIANKLFENPKAPRKVTTALIQSNVRLGDALQHTGQLMEAASCLRRAITLLEEQAINRPDNLNFKQQLESVQAQLSGIESTNENANLTKH